MPSLMAARPVVGKRKREEDARERGVEAESDGRGRDQGER
jgi:hypothetical protein